MGLLPARRRLAFTTALLSCATVLCSQTSFAQQPAEPAPAPAPAPGAASYSVKIGTSDAKGLIYLDGQLVGEGSYIGNVTAGTHKLKVTREGYEPFEEDLVVKEPISRTVTLMLSSKITTGQAEETERLEGLYGGFGLIGFLTPGGTGSSMQKTCEDKKPAALASCDAGSGMGAGIGGFVGYSWDPVGIEVYVAGHYDERTLKNDWNATSLDPGLGPDPARLEDFKVHRAGGMGLARVRVGWHNKRLRLDMIGGAGVAYRVMIMERVTTAKDNPVIRDAFASEGVSYLSPVIALEPTVMYRITPGIAVSLGFQMFFETPSSFMNGNETPTTTRERNHSLGPRSLTTPPYELASGVQFFMGPVLGMVFGP